MDQLHWQSLTLKLSATVTRVSHMMVTTVLTLANLGGADMATYKNDPISAAPPKAAKASTCLSLSDAIVAAIMRYLCQCK
jgi:hypothetical protein